MGEGWYHCNRAASKFTVRVGTVFERSHIPLNKWLLATHLLVLVSKKGISAHQLHRMLGVTYKTAWFMAHRIREAMKPGEPGPMGGEGKIVEADETYIGKKDGRKRQRAASATSATIVVPGRARRRGPLVPQSTTRQPRAHVRKILSRNVDRKSKLHDGRSRASTRASASTLQQHETVNHADDEYVRGDGSHEHH